MALRIKLCGFATWRETIARKGAVTLSGRSETTGKLGVKNR